MRLLACAALLLSLVGLCVQANADVPPEPEIKPQPAEVKLPWTAEDARKSWGKGVSFLFDVETEGGKGWMRWEAEDISEKGFKRTEIVFEGDTAPKRGKPSETTWEKHFSGLQRELAGAVKTKGKVTGSFTNVECEIYTLTKVESTLKIALSPRMPGMVVLMEMEATRGNKRDYEKWLLRSVDLPVCEAPWTDDKIAENFKAGTKTVYAGKSSDGDVKVEYVVNASDIKGMTYTATTATETNGKKEPKKADPLTVTWDGYLRYFVPPRFDAKTSEEKIKTPMGETECVVLSFVKESEGAKFTQKVWFAKNEPGLMVRYEIEQAIGDKKQFFINMELTEYVKGK